jgi:hypothetical protein
MEKEGQFTGYSDEFAGCSDETSFVQGLRGNEQL